jgi:hypothetical protein
LLFFCVAFSGFFLPANPHSFSLSFGFTTISHHRSFPLGRHFHAAFSDLYVFSLYLSPVTRPAESTSAQSCVGLGTLRARYVPANLRRLSENARRAYQPLCSCCVRTTGA